MRVIIHLSKPIETPHVNEGMTNYNNYLITITPKIGAQVSALSTQIILIIINNNNYVNVG